MPILQPLSVPQAAQELGLSTARVRAMAASGQLTAEKIGGRWLVEGIEVSTRQTERRLPGRRFTAMNAWAVLVISSDGHFTPQEGVTPADDVLLTHISPSVRSRLKRLLLSEGLAKLAPRLGARAEAFHYRVHPGELSHVTSDPALMATGITGAARYGLLSSKEVDGYLPARSLTEFVERHALSELPHGGGVFPPEPTVCLRAVPDNVWSIFGGKSVAPMAAVALDLMDGWGARSQEIGRGLARTLDREIRERQKGR
jgi:hypothetical protein